MKVFNDCKFVARHLTGSGQLYTEQNSLDEIKAYIDEVNNDRMLGKWISEPQSYIVCREEHEAKYDDFGLFVSSKTSIERIEIYPVK